MLLAPHHMVMQYPLLQSLLHTYSFSECYYILNYSHATQPSSPSYESIKTKLRRPQTHTYVTDFKAI